MRPTSKILATIVALGMVGFGSPAPTAVAVTPQAPAPVAGASPDFDGDGLPDIVYAFNGDAIEAAVRVVYGSGREQEIQRVVGDDTVTAFGHAILARDLNGDGYCDLAVTDSWKPGLLILIFGSAAGLEQSAERTFAAPAGASAFGSSLALLTAPTPLLVVGAEQSSVPGGSFAAYPLGSDGMPSGSPFWINQSSSGVPGTAEAGDRFGAALAAAGSTLVVGIDGEDIGKVKDAGNIVVLTYTGGQRFTGTGFGQNSSGVADKAETGDRFGASVAIGRGLLAVGVPGEQKQGGLVQLFSVSGSKVKPLTAIDQNSSGVPGAGERFDRFGEEVAIAQVCAGTVGIVVGGPGETFLIGGDGAAWVIPVKRSTACPARLLAEDGALGGKLIEDGGRLGPVVSVLGDGGSAADTVLVGGAGAEDIGPGRLYAVAAPYTPGHVVWKATDLDNQFGFALSPS
jgi:hypothetical protein